MKNLIFLLLFMGSIFSLPAAGGGETKDSEDVFKQFMDIFSEPGLDINKVNEEGASLLHIVAQIPDEDQLSVIIPELLKKGIDIHARDVDGDTPLHIAVYADNAPAVRILVENKASAELLNDMGVGAIHLAAMISGPEVFKIMIDGGADINFPDREGNTPFHLFLSRMALGAKFEGKEDINEYMEYFNQTDVNLDYENEDGITPREILGSFEDIPIKT